MKSQSLGNYLRTHRKRAGLSQRELGLILGYGHQGPVSRHERLVSTPPLAIALCYEVIFRVPVSDLFSGLHGHVTQVIESKLAALEEQLGKQSGRGRGADEVAKKLVWLTERKEL